MKNSLKSFVTEETKKEEKHKDKHNRPPHDIPPHILKELFILTEKVGRLEGQMDIFLKLQKQ